MNFDKLKDFLDYYLPMLGVPGSDTIIYKDHKEIFRHTSGFNSLKNRTEVRRDAIYNIYSCTKIATIVAILQLVERGELLISDPIYIYLPEYRSVNVLKPDSNGKCNVDIAKNPILVKDLIGMTSGYDYSFDRPSVSAVKALTAGKCPTREVVRALATDTLLFEPGEKYCYGLSHDILGGLIEVVSGMNLGEYMKKNIFDPLGMVDTGFRIEEKKLGRVASQYTYDNIGRCAIEVDPLENVCRFGDDYESGGAGLLSTVNDYVLLMDALANGGVGANGNRILSSRSVDLISSSILSPEINRQFAIYHNDGYEYCYGVRVMREPGRVGSLVPAGVFGFDGKKMCVAISDPFNKISVFHAEHIDGMNGILLPRLMNTIYSCIE